MGILQLGGSESVRPSCGRSHLAQEGEVAREAGNQIEPEGEHDGERGGEHGGCSAPERDRTIDHQFCCWVAEYRGCDVQLAGTSCRFCGVRFSRRG